MMSFNFRQLLNFHERENSYESKEIITALRDWKALLISVVVIAILVIIGSAYLFFEIDNEHIFQNKLPPASSPIIIDRELVGKVINSFEEKTRRFDELSRQAPEIIDPSIPVSVR